jgi:hypothetical protein
VIGDIPPELARAATGLVRDVLLVKAGESVLVTSDSASDVRAVAAIRNAAYALDAKPAVIVSPQLPLQGALANPYLSDPLKAAVAACDIWIDLCWPYIAGSDPFHAAMDNGRTRYYLVGDLSAESIIRIFGKVDLDTLFSFTTMFDDLLATSVGTNCRITTPTGTDVSFALGEPSAPRTGRPTGPGPLFVPGTVVLIPNEDTVSGTITLNSIFHEYYTLLREPIVLAVDGRISDLQGSFSEIKVLDRALQRASGGDGYGYVIHFSCGFHPTARVTGRSFIEDQRATGNDAVGMGLPFWAPGGGENHPDAVMINQSLWINDEQIVDRGRIIGPTELAKAAGDLKPRYG